MFTSCGSLPRRRVFLLAFLLIVLGAPGFSSRTNAPRAQTPPATSTPAPPPAAPAVPAAPSGFDFAGQREEVFKAFYTTGLDTSVAYTVSNLAIKKDSMTLLLRQGTVILMKPIGGEITGGAFVGDGEASVTPPSRPQRFMLNKYSGAEALKEPFTEAVFRFTDGTDRMIRAVGKPGPIDATSGARATSIFSDRNAWLDGTRELHLEMQYLENRISGLKGQDFFVADFHSAKHDWLTYEYNPEDFQENILFASATMGAKGRRYLIPWIQWHEAAEYDPAGHYVILPDHDGPHVIRVSQNDMTLNLPTTKNVEWEATIKIEPLKDHLHALLFDLDNNASLDARWYENFRPIEVLAVTDESGQVLPFMHKRDQILILLSQMAHTGVPLTVTIKGKAEVIYQLTAESFGLLVVSWYPQYGYRGGRSPFHWTVRVPKPFLITGSGKIVREFEDKEKGLNGIETLCNLPVDFPWIIFGRFQKNETVYSNDESKRQVPLTMHSFPTMTVSITDPDELEELGLSHPVTFNLFAPVKKVDGLLDEGKQILRLFEKIYGPYPYDELHVAQMAPQLDFGQAPQGFVQLSGAAFLSQAETESDRIHGFMSHEFAHQWWGHQIGWASQDDEWLSESFAEYASGIFVNEYQGPKRFQRTLETWKKSARLGDPVAPISAANMLNGPNAGDQRTYLLYNKGPYVLHMLRVQLDDETYTKVMRSVQETYKNQNISTEMLLREVNHVTGQDYTYFFDQWFWDVGIPKFRYSWRSERQADGKYLITVHVGQEDKNHIKRVLMPVYIHFKDKTIPQYKGVVQAEQDVKIMSPVEPKDVTLDDEHTLLADIVKAG